MRWSVNEKEMRRAVDMMMDVLGRRQMHRSVDQEANALVHEQGGKQVRPEVATPDHRREGG